MKTEKIAKKICEHAYKQVCDYSRPKQGSQYSLDEYWERNKKYFMEQAETYLSVKKCLEMEK